MRDCSSLGHNLLRYGDGGVVAQEPPSKLQRLWDALMGRKALQQAAGTAPPSLPPPQDTDISYVRRAAEEAVQRAEKAAAERAKKVPASR